MNSGCPRARSCRNRRSSRPCPSGTTSASCPATSGAPGADARAARRGASGGHPGRCPFALLRVRSPAPPPVALFGPLGMVLGQALPTAW
ncbi:DUF1427 family protein [Streptomyces sp. NPDC028722]|uniref:DUF1427 family protein n=1 Tax=unclassified Streptomyces TaxID=2593676 RepID=UPI0033CA469E